MSNIISNKRISKAVGLTHVGIIMDGNGRWAVSRGLSRIDGHKRGAERVKEIIQGAIEQEIKYLTLYAFSSENWKRPDNEVRDLMNLLRYFLGKELLSMKKSGVRLKIVGDISLLKRDILKKIEKALDITKSNKKIVLTVAINYGSRQEITNAIKKIAILLDNGFLKASSINERFISAQLNTVGVPDPDLIIRTGGEYRLSNFLLWQAAYSELIFIRKLWPDFSKDDFFEAIREYNKRERRFGGIRV